jgi:hypothetical protein
MEGLFDILWMLNSGIDLFLKCLLSMAILTYLNGGN